MKRIIKNNMATPIKCQCKDCGSLFEFDYTDIQRREETSLAFLYGSSTFTVRYVVCPVCAYENKFEDIKKDSVKLALDECKDAAEKWAKGGPNKEINVGQAMYQGIVKGLKDRENTNKETDNEDY